MVFAEYNIMGAQYLFFLIELGDGKLNSMKVMWRAASAIAIIAIPFLENMFSK